MWEGARSLQRERDDGTLDPKLDPNDVAALARNAQKAREQRAFCLSGRQDLNLRPPGPQRVRSRVAQLANADAKGLTLSELSSHSLTLFHGLFRERVFALGTRSREGPVCTPSRRCPHRAFVSASSTSRITRGPATAFGLV